MIEIRRKRQSFHDSIRMTQRHAIRKNKREQFAAQQQRQQLINAINKVYNFCENWEEEKHNFWTNGPSNSQYNYSSSLHFLQDTSQNLKELILRYQLDSSAKLQISENILQNLSFLVPPPHDNLNQLPKSFIQLCLFVLRNPKHDASDKENFIDSLPYETIVRCLLRYFAQNWTEIKTNKCDDITMNFFFQFNKYKNVFTNSMYNDQNFQFLLNDTINEILNLASQQISIYQRWNHLENQIDNQNEYSYFEPNNLSLNSKDYTNEERIYYVMKFSTFLVNILLLSPQPNYNIKEVKNRLKTIAHYLYRKILLTEINPNYHISAQLCVSILLGYSSSSHQNKEIQIMTKIFSNQMNRIRLQESNCSNENNQDFEIDRKVPSKEQNLEGSDIIQNDSNTNAFLNRMSLLMVSRMAQRSVDIRYMHVEKWLYFEMRKAKESIFKLQNVGIIKCLLLLLSKLLANEDKSNEHQKSYYGFSRRISDREEQKWRIKGHICKLIDKKGFNQLLMNSGLKHYSQELCILWCSLIEGIEKMGDISSIIYGLFEYDKQEDGLKQQQEYEEIDQDEDSSQQQQNDISTKQRNIILSLKTFLVSNSRRFLEKAYKYISYDKKQRLMLELVNLEQLSGEEINKCLTLEERQWFRKVVEWKWENYYDEEEDEMLLMSGRKDGGWDGKEDVNNEQQEDEIISYKENKRQSQDTCQQSFLEQRQIEI